MSEIPVYASEKDAGLVNQIQRQNSVAYVVPLSVCENPQDHSHLFTGTLKDIEKLAKATNLSQSDLFYLTSILVTTCWNSNDDVFYRSEVWAARNTPEDKPINIEHNDSDIIGHITGCVAINAVDNSIISGEVVYDSLPDKFHLVTGGVLYKAWSKPELQERIDKLIKAIAAGERYVSMECLFRNFDYAVQYSDGTQKVVARNSETAFLTKHLRAYGGTGNYQNLKVGRLLRNFSFSGKGIVEKPANPESVIFKESNTFEGVFASAKILENEVENKMSKELEQEVAELKEAVKKSEAKHAGLEKTIQELITKEASLASQLYEANKKIEDTNKAHEASFALKVEEIKGVTAKFDEVNTKYNDLIVKARDEVRKHQLVKSGKTEDEAVHLVEKFADLDDEAFAGVLEVIPKVEPKDDEDTEGKSQSGVLDSVETPKEPELNVTGPTKDDTLKTIAAFFGEMLEKKHK